jgi:hypothetical protein
MIVALCGHDTKEKSPAFSGLGQLKWSRPLEGRFPMDHAASSNSVIDQMWSAIPASIAGVKRRAR